MVEKQFSKKKKRMKQALSYFVVTGSQVVGGIE